MIQFFNWSRTISAVCKFINVLSGCLHELKTKEKSNPKSGCDRSRELFIAKFKSQFKLGFTKVAITRAGRLLEWSQGEL